jgi:T-complex protein 10 C-terminus
MYAVHHVPSYSWDGNIPSDDTVVMDAADAVLQMMPPNVAQISSKNVNIETKNVETDQNTLYHPLRTVSPNERCDGINVMKNRNFEMFHNRSTGTIDMKTSKILSEIPQAHDLSTLSSDIDKVIRYLENLRSNSNTQLHPRKKEAKQGACIATTETKNSIFRQTIDPIIVEDAGISEGSGTIFRPASILESRSLKTPAIRMAYSIHSKGHEMASPIPCILEEDGDLDLSAVSNLINSMCVENQGKSFDWTFLDKIQEKVEQLLVQARKQREATDEWIRAVRQSVEIWVHEQRLQIECERKQALERAIQEARVVVSREKSIERTEDIFDSAALQEKLIDLIEKQGKKIEELESKFDAVKALDMKSSNLQTPYFQQRESRLSESAQKFFRDIENHESPTLPHLPRTEIRPQRDYIALKNGRRVIQFRNGTEREYLPDGTIITRYTNGDVKTEEANNGIVTYWHHEEQTKQTTFPNGLQVYEYPNKQIERHFPDGRKEVILGSGARRLQASNGTKFI